MGTPIMNAGNTRPVFGFPGGVHPPEHKAESCETPIRVAPLPARLVLPLSQHAGAPAEAVVAVGEKVLKGQLVAKAKGAISANLHAPTSGTVSAIGLHPVQHPSGLEQPCIVIDSDGADTWIAHEGIADWANAEPVALLTKIRDAGIAGMGGAGFPTAVKLAPNKPIEKLILNAVECEPYITADDRLMRERAAEVIEGLRILAHILKPREVLVGIEDNKPAAIAAMRHAADGSGIDVVVVPTKYPSGGEKQLIQNLTGKEVPSGRLPADVGVVCTNTGTAHAVKRAVVDGEPLVSRITTLTGEALTRRGNVEALVGTPVIDLLRDAGLDERRLHRLVMGGPMMGFTLRTTAVPMVKTTNCLIAASVAELPDPAPEMPCIRCGACAEACPASLLPQQLQWFAKSGELEKAQDHHLMDCIECGACAFVCPSSIPLVQYYRHAKGEVRRKQAEERKAERAKQRFEARVARLEREQAEREAKRRARAEGRGKPATASAPAAAAGPTAEQQDAMLKSLKDRSLKASADYKTAVKALRDAEGSGSGDIAALTAQVESLKAVADAAKAAVRAAQNGEFPAEMLPSAGAAPAVDLDKLKREMNEASAAYKAALRIAKEAQEAGATSAGELRAESDRLKQIADALKARVREAKADAPEKTGSDPISRPAPETKGAGPELPGTQNPLPLETPAASPATMDAAGMKLLKTAVATTAKQHKEAVAALETATRAGAANLETMQARVDALKQKADDARAALDAVVAQMKQSAPKEEG